MPIAGWTNFCPTRPNPRPLISARSENGAAFSPKRIEIHVAEPRQDHRVLKLACRRIAGARERQRARVFECERASPAFGHNWTHDLLSFARLQVAFLVPI